jgi:hypothetical protein
LGQARSVQVQTRTGDRDPGTGGDFVVASISERENREIEAANASGSTPFVLVHGLWLLPTSWADWADFFQQGREQRYWGD